MPTEPIGLSRDLPAKRVMRTMVDGQDIAVWRSASGKIAAWANRCPHRGMRLSHGFVRGENLACLYHGWHYGAHGRCTYIPAHPELEPPATIMAQAFSVEERDGLIWVASDGTAEPRGLPGGLAPLRSLTFQTAKSEASEAFSSTPFEGNPPAVQSSDAGGIVLRVDVDSRTLNIAAALHEANQGETTAHLLVSDEATPAQKVSLSRWCEAVRRRAEAHVTTRGQENAA